MSFVEFRNERTQAVIDLSTSQPGELKYQDRVVRRGQRELSQELYTYEAVFTYDMPVICDEDDVPDNGGYFRLENGRVEVTQLIGRFDTDRERMMWIERTFARESHDV